MSNNPCQGEPGVQRSFQRLSTTPLFSSPVMDEAVDVADSWEDADAEVCFQCVVSKPYGTLGIVTLP